jgi:type IV pilus assembly protein PilA
MGRCPYCEGEIPEETAYCISCGRSLANSVSIIHASRRTIGLAVGSLILSLSSMVLICAGFIGGNPSSVVFFMVLVTALSAILLGHLARARIKRSPDGSKGSRVALAGLALGYGVLVAPLLLHVIVFALSRTLERRNIPANEASTIGSLRTIHTASETYASDGHGFPPGLLALGSSGPYGKSGGPGEGLIDDVLANGKKSGYAFTYKITAMDNHGWPSAFAVNADPLDPGTSGRRHFFTDETGVIRESMAGPADKHSQPLPE